MKPRKIPLRKCVITNERLPKKELIRVVRHTDGNVYIDETGKMNGRGAYLQRKKAVINKAIKTRKLDRHLEVNVPDELYQELLGMFDE